MQSEDWYSLEKKARALYDRVKNNEITFADLSIAEVIMLNAYLNEEIERKMLKFKMLYDNKKEQ